MKHLLFISILIFSSLLVSCDKKEETLYRWETSSGFEWKTIGDKNNNPQYKGEVKREYLIFGDYIKEGLGSLTYPDGQKYVGEWKDGIQHGQGTYTFSGGSRYVGEFKDGLPNGQGTETQSDGTKYVGEWKNGKFNGQGTLTFPDGGKYVGEYKDDKRWNGIYYDQNGNILEKWVNGK